MQPNITTLTVCGLLCVQAFAAATEKKTNIVVILADDLGYGDVQCYNPQRGKIPTPHIDKLASQGMRFTDAHSSSGVCTPSRYTILMKTMLEKLIVDGRSTPGVAQMNDVEVKRYPTEVNATPKKQRENPSKYPLMHTNPQN